MPKMLLVFCDGTGKDGNLSRDNSFAQSTEGDVNTVCESTGIREMISLQSSDDDDDNDNKQFPTNIIRLARSVISETADGKKQIVFYQSGVGSEADFEGDKLGGTLVSQALGTAVASKIRDAYAFVAQNFEDGDEICIFGFSRGAYTARKLSGLIDRIGLLARQNLGQFFLIWSQLMDNETPTIPRGTRRARIKCVGVWDTVGSVNATIDALAIKDTSLPATVDIALHALALQENREAFLPTLWTKPKGGLPSNQTLKQVWFPGAHSDVGGGYQRRELADIALFWMVGEIKSFIELDFEFLRSTRQQNPDPWGTSQPHNAYMEHHYAVRLAVGLKTRLESGHITTTSTFHQSLAVSPQDLVSPDDMPTTSIILKTFGPGFSPRYHPLNEFEVSCKNTWHNTRMGASKPPIFGSSRNVIRSPVCVVGDKSSVRWVLIDGPLSAEKLGGAVAVGGGMEADGVPLYIAQAAMNGGIHCGKVKDNYCANIPYGGSEIIATSYSVLVFC